MGARNAPSMAHYGPGPGYPAPSSQMSGPGGWKSWRPPAGAGGTQAGMLRVQAQVDPRHAWMFLLPRPPATHGVALPRRSDAQTMAAQLDLSHSARVRPGQVNPRLPCLGSQPAHQPCVYGMAWVGLRDRNAPWMAHFEPPWTGSRRVPRPHPRRPATHQPEMPVLLWLCLPLHGHGQHQPRSPPNTRPVILRLSRRPRGH